MDTPPRIFPQRLQGRKQKGRLPVPPPLLAENMSRPAAGTCLALSKAALKWEKSGTFRISSFPPLNGKDQPLVDPSDSAEQAGKFGMSPIFSQRLGGLRLP